MADDAPITPPVDEDAPVDEIVPRGFNDLNSENLAHRLRLMWPTQDWSHAVENPDIETR